MHFLESTVAALALSITGAEAGLLRRSSDGNPAASKYTDNKTNITFMGYASGTGFKFGMALPESPTSDTIVQLISPLNKNGAGWGAIDFGSEMTGYLMIAAWPDTSTKTTSVKISPRIATGYEVDNGANVYSKSNITITQIPSGTFVNDSHVAATFVCGGCINAADSFESEMKKGASATFSYAYSLTAVASPGKDDTQLSDHTSNGELYGPFDVALKQAESSEYVSWAKLTTEDASGTGKANATESGSTTTTTTSSTSESESGSSSSGESSSGSTSSSSSSTSSAEDATGFSTGGIIGLTALGLVYVLQAIQIL